MPGSNVPTELPWYGILRNSRDDVQFDYEVRRRHSKGSLRKLGIVGWYDDVSGYRRQDAKGDHCTRAFDHENKDNRAAREEVLRLDRWLNSRESQYFPTDVDLEARIRRVRTIHRSQKMLLKIFIPLLHCRF